MTSFTRRNFLKTSVIGGVAATCINPFETLAASENQVSSASRIALTTGDNRADMAYRALKPFSKEILQAIGKRRVILKPNLVNINIPLASTHAIHSKGYLNFSNQSVSRRML